MKPIRWIALVLALLFVSGCNMHLHGIVIHSHGKDAKSMARFHPDRWSPPTTQPTTKGE